MGVPRPGPSSATRTQGGGPVAGHCAARQIPTSSPNICGKHRVRQGWQELESPPHLGNRRPLCHTAARMC